MFNRAIRTLIITVILLIWSLPSRAMTLTEALAQSYRNNPSLAAAQARLRAVDTTLAEAQSGWRPSADLLADAGVGRTRFRGDSDTDFPRDVTLSVTQPIWRGGETEAQIDRAEAEIRAERARLIVAEQNVLLQAATAYLDVRRDTEIRRLEQDNLARLQQQLDASNKRFEAGELTVTDVHQAQARLAGAEANLATAAANLEISESGFAQIVGRPALNLTEPNLAISLPPSLQAAQDLAASNDPQIAAATYSQQAAQENIGVAKSALRPDIALKLDMTRSWVGTSFVNSGARVDDARVVGSIVVPLYRGGGDYARLAGARETASARMYDLQQSRNQSQAQVIAAWSSLQASEAASRARAQQIGATEQALAGVQMVNQVGTRTVLDVLDAQQELRNARIGEAQSRRDMAVAQLQLLAVGGQLTARKLKLPVDYYDPGEHFRAIDGTWAAGQ